MRGVAHRGYRWRARNAGRIQSFGKPVVVAQYWSDTMDRMRAACVGTFPRPNCGELSKKFPAIPLVRRDMVGMAVEQLLVPGVGTHRDLNGAFSKGRLICVL